MNRPNVLPVVLIPYRLDGNIYIRELGRAYHNAGTQVAYGFENLFEPALSPELLHIHWPELYRSTPYAQSEMDKAHRFLAAIDIYKEQGTKVVWTVHNLTPHEDSPAKIGAFVYQGVIDRADIILHHCHRSVSLLAEHCNVSSHAKHIVSPHGNYFSYPSGASKEDSRKWLGIPEGAFVYLHFGNIRGYKGFDNLLSAFDSLEADDKWLLVAGKYSSISDSNDWREQLVLWKERKLRRRATLNLHQVPEDRIQCFMAASDCVVLSHRQGLNSGVAVLAISYGRPVIGPDMGCIGEILSDGINITYTPGNVDSLTMAMKKAKSIDRLAAEKENRALAGKWTWDVMANMILNHARMKCRQ